MTVGKYLARQFSNPSGLIAGILLPRLWNRRNASLNDLTFSILGLSPGDRVLEVGCGGGYLLGHMSKVITVGSLVGVDVSAAMVAHCRRRFGSLVQSGRLELYPASAERLPLQDETFTHACSVNALFYFQEVDAALYEFWRVLVPGGRVVVTFTCLEDLVDHSFARHGLNLFKEQEVIRMMENSGFNDIKLHEGTDRHRHFFCVVGNKP